MMSVKFCNVLILGLAFMFIFTNFLTICNIEKTLIDSISRDDPTFTADAYTSLAIIYTTLAFCNWLAPSLISCTGPRAAMLLGAFTYIVFTFTFLNPTNWWFYFASALLGVGAAFVWTGQGNFFARCSDPGTATRNSGIFWGLLQCSMFFGNWVVFQSFHQKQHIDDNTRSVVIVVLFLIAVIGMILLAFLRPLPEQLDPDDVDDVVPQSKGRGAVEALVSALRLYLTPRMLLLNELFFYTGIELAFFSGVYGSSVGFTKKIGESPKEIVGLIGMYTGAGEVIGASLFGIFGDKFIRFGRTSVVVGGYLAHMIAFFLIFLNLPNNSPFRDTEDISHFDPPIHWVAMLCAFLLGLGDACINTQIYAILGTEYAEEASGAFAIFKFMQSSGAAIAFFYASHLGLHLQLGILVILGTLGTRSFFIMRVR